MRRTGYSWSWEAQERPLSRELKVRRSWHACPAQRGFAAEGTAGRAATCNSDSIFFSSFTAQYHFILTHNSGSIISYSLPSFLPLSFLRPALELFCVPHGFSLPFSPGFSHCAPQCQCTVHHIWLAPGSPPKRGPHHPIPGLQMMGHELHLPSQRGRRMVFLLKLT